MHASVRLGLLVAVLASGRAGAEPALADDSPLAPPSPRDARAMGVGRHVPDAVGVDLDGNRRGWRSGRGDAVTVIALTSVTCPLCRKFGPTLARVEAAFAARGVRFVVVNVSGTDSVKDMRTQAGSLGLKGLSLRDADGTIAAALGARTTTEVFVIDAANTLVYRGAASDQYGTNFTLEAARRRYLEDAIEAALAGQVPAVQATSSPGCALEPRPAAVKAASASAATVTYARDIARIIQANCVECHRQGGVGPFALDSYEAVSRRATMIRTVTEAGTMPPWFAAPAHAADGTAAPSPWANDRSMSVSDKLAIAAWVDAGKPEGDRADLPLPRTFPGGEWTIGRPDAVFQIPAPIAVKADGFMAYQHVMVPTGLTEDRWVKAVQIVPTDPSVVHHVLVFALSERDAADAETRRRLGNDEAGGYWAAYVPGNDSMVFPERMAKRLPARSTLLFQIHYTPNGTATADQMKLGVVYADRAPEHVVRTASVASRRISIPPGAPNHREAGQVRVPADAVILAFTPHMHVRGKAYRYELEAADGSERKTILDVPEYDFNWQLRYLLREPLRAPKGSILHGTAWYDNSADNPANPDPTKTVRWGPQTVDEMMLGYIEYYLAEEDPTQPDELPEGGAIRRGLGGGAAGPAGGRARGMAFERLRSQFDADGNGRIERAEVPESLHPQFDRLDRSKDGVLTADDFAR